MWSIYKTPRANHSLNSIPWYHRRASREVALLTRHFVRCVVCSGKSKCVLCARQSTVLSLPGSPVFFVAHYCGAVLVLTCSLVIWPAPARRPRRRRTNASRSTRRTCTNTVSTNTYGFCLEWWWSSSSSSTSCVSVSWKA